MNNLQRLELETKDISLKQNELIVYLQETGLEPFEKYSPQSATNKKQIYEAALSVLESIANSPKTMKNVKHDDMTISNFAVNIQNRIDQLEQKVRKLKTDEQLKNETNFFMLFNQ